MTPMRVVSAPHAHPAPTARMIMPTSCHRDGHTVAFVLAMYLMMHWLVRGNESKRMNL